MSSSPGMTRAERGGASQSRHRWFDLSGLSASWNSLKANLIETFSVCVFKPLEIEFPVENDFLCRVNFQNSLCQKVNKAGIQLVSVPNTHSYDEDLAFCNQTDDLPHITCRVYFVYAMDDLPGNSVHLEYGIGLVKCKISKSYFCILEHVETTF